MNEISPVIGRRDVLNLSNGLVIAFSLFKPASALGVAAASGPLPDGVPPDAAGSMPGLRSIRTTPPRCSPVRWMWEPERKPRWRRLPPKNSISRLIGSTSSWAQPRKRSIRGHPMAAGRSAMSGRRSARPRPPGGKRGSISLPRISMFQPIRLSDCRKVDRPEGYFSQDTGHVYLYLGR